MADVAAEEEERLPRGAHERGDVACCVAWHVEDVETAVAEVVVGLVGADFEVLAEGRFDDGAAGEVCFVEDGGWVRGPAWFEGFFEAGADDYVG